jgi:capsular polysaccharide biosynthesis protein
MDKYAALRTEIETAQIDLETAQAAFKYRYSVVTPAHLPKRPTKPNVPLVVLAALVAALLCGPLLAVLVDVRTGRVLERWQIERLLERPILGEISLPVSEAPDFE